MSSETQVPSSAVNSTVRSGFKGRPWAFFFGGSFFFFSFVFDSGFFSSFACAVSASVRSWTPIASGAATNPMPKTRPATRARRWYCGFMGDPFLRGVVRTEELCRPWSFQRHQVREQVVQLLDGELLAEVLGHERLRHDLHFVQVAFEER